MRMIHHWMDDSATIAIEGLKRPLRVLHITDSLTKTGTENLRGTPPLRHLGSVHPSDPLNQNV